MAIWIGASFVVRISLEASMGGSSIYGPLSTPIVLLVWMYALAVAILIGAGLNAAVRTLWPVDLHEGADVRLVNWAREGAEGLLGRGDGDGDSGTPSAGSDRASGDAEPNGKQAADIGRRHRDEQFESGDRGRLGTALRRGVGERSETGEETADQPSRQG